MHVPLHHSCMHRDDSYDTSQRCYDFASTSLPYELSLPVEKSAGLYCMIITFKGFLSGASVCYNMLSTTGGEYLTIGIRECKPRSTLTGFLVMGVRECIACHAF